MNYRRLVALYEKAEPNGKFFSKGALNFFGSTLKRAHRSVGGHIIYSELQRKAPCPHQWAATPFSAEGKLLGETFHAATRAEAIAQAEDWCAVMGRKP